MSKSQATLLVELVDESMLFHFGEECYASLLINGHYENWPLRTKGFRRWLSHRFFQEKGKTPNGSAMQSAIETLAGKAQFQGQEHQLFVRLAEHEGVIYLDLANEEWDVIEITPDGWQITASPPVKFRRARGMLPLPKPMAGGSSEILQSFLNVSSEDWPLLIAWLLAAFRPKGPYPILVLHGEQGSAKSTLAKLLRSLVDPNSAPLRSEPKEPRDLMIAATNGWMVALDNLSHLYPWLSDCLCRLATGGGFATRELYSDNEEMLFEAQRPVILNGIEELATRGDLLDRAIILYLPTIAEDKRQTEDSLWTQFEAARPQILGALLEVVSQMMRQYPAVRLDRLPRMADFARWATAAEPALGWGNGTFLQTYAGNREQANGLTLDTSAIAEPLLGLIDTGRWVGTATELLATLTDRVDQRIQNRKGWPSSAHSLSNAIRRLAPNLRTAGLAVSFERGRRRLIILEGIGKDASSASPGPDTTLLASDDHVDADDAENPTDSNLELFPEGDEVVGTSL